MYIPGEYGDRLICVLWIFGICVGDAWEGIYCCSVKERVGLYTGNIDLMGSSSSGDLLGACVALLLARTRVALVENAGDTVRARIGLDGDLGLPWS